MPVSRQLPFHEQISEHYKRLISSGELKPGEKLPTDAQIAAVWKVSTQTAFRAKETLRAGKLITTTRDGSVVAGARLVPGPQQVLAGTRFPHADSIVVTAAELIPAPEYIVPILGVRGYGPGGVAWVIRREQVYYEPGDRPLALAVCWYPGVFADAVPELLAPAPIEPWQGIRLIGERAGRVAIRGRIAREARPIKDDGREGPLLQVPAGYVILAEAHTWHDDEDVLEYGETDLIQGRVTENEFIV